LGNEERPGVVVTGFDENGTLLRARTQELGGKDMIVSTGKDTVNVCHVESCEIQKNSRWGVESLGHEMSPTLCTLFRHFAADRIHKFRHLSSDSSAMACAGRDDI